MSAVQQRLTALRELMRAQSIDYYWVPARDEHNNEYVPEYRQRRRFISGFSGSAGDVLVGLNAAYLWTDGRYFLQAEQQLDPAYFKLMRTGIDPTVLTWLKQQPKSLRYGVDPTLLSWQQAQDWQNILSTLNSELVAIANNLIDAIWTDQPTAPLQPVYLKSLHNSGLSSLDKLYQLRECLRRRAVDALVITTLDSIAWLFNWRGYDIAYNPLVISYAMVTQDAALLFVERAKIDSSVAAELTAMGVTLLPYEEFEVTLQHLMGRVWVDPKTAGWQVGRLATEAELLLEGSPLELMKAIKNPVEREGMVEAHRQDAVAMVRFLAWLEGHWQEGVDELSAARYLDAAREGLKDCLGLSFMTISGFGEHGAVIHYAVDEVSNVVVDDSNLYLVDSGGQYHQGTTDITRTIHLGVPTAIQRRHYTWVLKGHLALRRAVFPAGTCGEQLDVLARQFLWRAGLNYAHGTGHGVGCHLCVHEGPHRISPGLSGVPLQPGMMVSNEPGVYLPGHYGVRIENVCMVVPAVDLSGEESSDAPYYTFADLTQVPYARNLIDVSLLTGEEIDWVDEYHRGVYELLRDELGEDERGWLREATRQLSQS